MAKKITPRAPQGYEVDDPTYWPKGLDKWTPKVQLQLFLYFGTCFFFANIIIPNSVFDPQTMQITIIIGTLGVWRYSWWSIHAIRAWIYGKIVYPGMRDQGAALWESGWRPRHLHFMMTTYKEHKDITEKVVRSICKEIKAAGVPGTIWLGSSVIDDEVIIEDFLRREFNDLDLTLRIIRQNVPGKRVAIGLVLRAMSRANVPDDDLVVFMDGDFILEDGAVRNCLPLFKLYPDLQACTTDEEVIVLGPRWVEIWLKMRFAQRRLAMQSHALSGRVLTLTGRMSVFRANHLKKLELIRLLEADYLNHWLWGNFRFLSGDDKSTWYFLLKQNAKMLYVPDALGYTVEVIDGSGMDRMVQNFRRWSGNMLRNGMRAMKLGPRAMPFFIWWCLLDQRVSIWTMLVSPTLAVCTSLLYSPYYILSYILFVAVTRMMLSLFLFGYSRKVHISYPLILYANQIINASVKVYAIFRLSKQRWANRGNQSAGDEGTSPLEKFRNFMAIWCTTTSVAILFVGVILYTGLLQFPSMQMARTFLP